MLVMVSPEPRCRRIPRHPNARACSRSPARRRSVRGGVIPDQQRALVREGEARVDLARVHRSITAWVTASIRGKPCRELVAQPVPCGQLDRADVAQLRLAAVGPHEHLQRQVERRQSGAAAIRGVRAGRAPCGRSPSPRPRRARRRGQPPPTQEPLPQSGSPASEVPRTSVSGACRTPCKWTPHMLALTRPEGIEGNRNSELPAG
jgi:hypothetical protein